LLRFLFQLIKIKTMKKNTTIAAVLFFLTAMLLILPVAIHAQQAENTSVISYQGSVKTNSGSPIIGDHLITATLYSDANGTLPVWSGTYKQQITGGLFTVLLGSGAYPLPAAQDFSKTLWIGVKIDGGQELKPLTQLTGAPYSVSIADKSVTKDKIAVDYVGSIMVNGKRITGKGTTLNLVDGLNTSLLYNEETNSLSLNSIRGIGNPTPQGGGVSWTTGLNTIGAGNPSLFGSDDAFDVIMEAHLVEQMRMLGKQAAGSTGTFGILFPPTDNTNPSSGVGVIYQGTTTSFHTYIHSYGGITNFFAGNDAGNLSMSGTTCTGIGNQALTANTSGVDNVACGYWALYKNTTGDKNTAIGACALQFNQDGGSNGAVCWGALDKNVSGYYNDAFGNDALHENLNGGGNCAFGVAALYNTTASYNSGFGFSTLNKNTTGSYNTASGSNALYSNTTGSDNTASGSNALYSNTTGSDNTAIGYEALYLNTTGYWNTASGFSALQLNTTGNDNTAGGYNALMNNTTGNDNSAIGALALYSNTTGTDNTASGFKALYNNTTGNDNTANGSTALLSNTTGNNNTASGFEALHNNSSGDYNTANGWAALVGNTTGNDNTASGMYALVSNTTGNDNTADGYEALYNTTTGFDNTALGSNAGFTNTTGSNNTFVGYTADASTGTLTNASAIGNGAIVSASNTIQLGNTSVSLVNTSGAIKTPQLLGAGANHYAQQYTVPLGDPGIGTVSFAIANTIVTANSVVVASIILATNGTSIKTVVPTANTITITFNGGNVAASDQISYIVVNP
jgi:hypothetical protein